MYFLVLFFVTQHFATLFPTQQAPGDPSRHVLWLCLTDRDLGCEESRRGHWGLDRVSVVPVTAGVAVGVQPVFQVGLLGPLIQNLHVEQVLPHWLIGVAGLLPLGPQKLLSIALLDDWVCIC